LQLSPISEKEVSPVNAGICSGFGVLSLFSGISRYTEEVATGAARAFQRRLSLPQPGFALLQAGDIRLECYRLARELLFAHGYRQVSMRMFQKTSSATSAGPVYCCQEDGMLGLGCGARSYTSSLHYSTEYAVGATGVRSIIDDYMARPEADFSRADYGFVLDDEEQRRRYLIQSLLQAEGLNFDSYSARFGSDARADVPQLVELAACGLVYEDEDTLRMIVVSSTRMSLAHGWALRACARR
jgi:oxygen-independent coproporphyrinogen-3 oxidase